MTNSLDPGEMLLSTIADDKFSGIFHGFQWKQKSLTFHLNGLPADDSHEILSPNLIFKRNNKT